MRAIWILALTTMREAARRKIVLMAVLVAAAFLLLYGAAFYFAAVNPNNVVNAASRLLQQQAAGMFLLLGLYAANLLVGLVTILASIDTLSGEMASGAIQTLVSKPLARGQLLLGKWLGFVLLLTAFLAALEGGVMAIVWSFTRYTPPHALHGMALLWLEMVLLLTVTLLWGTRFSTLANGVLSLGLFGVAFLGGWIEQVGALAHQPHAVQVGIVASLIMPSEALWHRAAFEMQSPLMSILTEGPRPFFSTASIPSPTMVAYAALYAAVALALALRLFASRDL
jgi:Cu-processing system permease protein